MENLTVKDIKLKHPSNILISGPSFSGKTVLLRNLLKHYKTVFSGFENLPVLKIIYCYGVNQPLYSVPISDDVIVNYFSGIPTIKDIIESKCNVVVFDDLMHEISENNELVNVFTKFSHHKNITVILVVQNLFLQTKKMRTLSLNSHYIIVMRNPRDKLQIQKLAQQIDPGNVKRVMECFNDATADNFGYLVIDLRNDTNDEARFKTNIFPDNSGNWTPILYVTKQKFNF